MDDTLFFKILNEKHKDLLEAASKKKYTFMVPPAKNIAPNMLIRTFFDNHTFFHCEYDEKMQISLNGRVLQFNNNQFTTFLGYKRIMTFNVLDESMREVSNNYIKVIYIDNVIDETTYNVTSSHGNFPKKEVLKKCSNMEDYIKYFTNLSKLNADLQEIDSTLDTLIKKLLNNYILIKNHVNTYSKYFQESCSDFKQFLSTKLNKYKIDDSFNLIIYELCESLIFNKMYQFLFMNIKQFNSDEETEFKAKINNMRNDFSFSLYKLDVIFNECKFKTAIAEIKKLSNYNSPFEKYVSKYDIMYRIF